MVFEEPFVDNTSRKDDVVKATCDLGEPADFVCLDPRPSRSEERMVVSLADIKTRVAKPKGIIRGASSSTKFLVLTYCPSNSLGVRKEYDWVESVKPVLIMDDWDELEDTFSEDGWEEIDGGKQRASGRKSYSAVASRKRG
jgi:hypothetical protein